MLATPSHRLCSIFLMLGMVTAAISGCTPASKEAVGITAGQEPGGNKIGLPCQLAAAKSENSPGSKYPVRFVIDGSASMAGFVKNGNGRYNKLIELLDNITLNANPEYLRVDEKVTKLDRAGFQQAKGAAFYGGKTNKIADALESGTPKTNGLTLIVTDLQQDDGDTKQATKKLVDNYLQQPGYGVAILGFRGEFDGLVYPPSGAAYAYRAKDLSKGHPFYLLLVGPMAQLNDFSGQLRSQGGDLLSEHHLSSVFSPTQLVTAVGYRQESDRAKLPEISTPSSLLQDGIALKKGDQPMEILEIGNKATGVASLDYQLTPKQDAAVASSWITQVTTTVKKYNGQKDFVVDDNTKVWRSQHTVGDQSVTLKLAIDTDNLQRGLYYVTTDVQVTGIKTPSQWDAWHDGGQNNGAKTAGLKEFLDSLATGVSGLTQAKPVTIARLCQGIQKN
jgi:hypothetical protein